MAECPRSSASASSLSRATASLSRCQDPSFFLPRFVRDGECILRADYTDEGNQGGHQTYQFTVKWIGRSRKAEECFDRLLCRQEEEDPVGLVECEGPCGQKIHPDKVVQFGDCSHNICTDCLNSATTSVSMIDGSPGCCNKDCLEKHHPPRRLRSSSPPATAVSQMSLRARGFGLQASASQVFVVHLTVVHFYMDHGSVDRKMISFEMRSSCRLDQLKHKLSKHISIHEKSNVYFTRRENYGRRDLSPLLSFDDRLLEDLTDGGERLIVVITDPFVGVYR